MIDWDVEYKFGLMNLLKHGGQSKYHNSGLGLHKDLQLAIQDGMVLIEEKTPNTWTISLTKKGFKFAEQLTLVHKL